MTYSYPSYPIQYAVPESTAYRDSYVSVNRQSSLPVAIAGSVLGLTVGGIIGICKKAPYVKGGVPTDSFTKSVVDKYMKNAPEAESKVYKQNLEVIKKLDKVKTASELKALLDKNPEAVKEISNSLRGASKSYLRTITDKNLSSNKKVIKNNLEAATQTRIQKIKNDISVAWDSEKKKFIKPDKMDEKMFKAIKKSTRKTKAKFIAKYAAIAAAISGCVAFALDKFIAYKRNYSQQ